MNEKLRCQGFLSGKFASSYSPETGELCRCGGIPMRQGVCILPTSVKYTYDVDFSTTTLGENKPLCGAKSDWAQGKFVEGRYQHDKCVLFDANPWSLVERFKNKFFFIDGDSHQQDLFWGFLHELRNLRFIGVPENTQVRC
jgi:hypothetical protein